MSYIRITLLSDLCAGNGESKGNAIDNDTSVDGYGLPVIPARRLKGVLSETGYWLLKKVQDMSSVHDLSCISIENIEKLFGNRFGNQGALLIRNAEIANAKEIKYWLKHELPDYLRETATPSGITSMYAYVRGQTRMKNGIAEDGSLRFTRVINRHDPFDIHCNIVFIAPVILQEEAPELEQLLSVCCNATHHVGTHRNRGLGRVRMEFIREKDGQNQETALSDTHSEETMRIVYRVSIDSPVTLPDANDASSAIPSKSVIGCMASSWLKIPGHNASMQDFQDLFLNGTVVWSDLTPSVDGLPSSSIPLFITKLKNKKGPKAETLFCNRLAAEGKENLQEKQSTLEGRYWGQSADGTWKVLSVHHNMEYHHRHEHPGRSNAPAEQLYMQESIDEGQMYAGYIIAPKRLAYFICFLLDSTVLNFGKSKSAQYGNCSLYGKPQLIPETTNLLHTKEGDFVAAVLETDLLLVSGGVHRSDCSALKERIQEQFPLKGTGQEFCRFRNRGGYHAMWQMQKPVMQAMASGSCLCFQSMGGDIPERVQIGEYKQEGYGIVRFLTSEQLESMVDIKEGVPDHNQTDCLVGNAADDFRQALLLQQAKMEIRQAAHRWYKEQFYSDEQQEKKKLAAYQTGRLRLMLEQSKDLQDFRNRINNISLSDASSENKGHRSIYNEMVCGIYGSESEDTPKSIVENILGKRLTFEKKELYNQILASESLLNSVSSQWKLFLFTVLYRMHYEQKGGDRK